MILIAANVVGIVSKLYLGHPYIFGMVSLFNFDTEANIPTLYSALLRQITVLFVVSAVVFVAGAIGFELVDGRQYEAHGADDIVYAILYTCEESLEMLGTAIFIYALLLYIARRFEDKPPAIQATSNTSQ